LIEAIAQQLVLIIKHKHTEDEVRKANTYINAMGDALIVLDMERNVIHLNAAGINLFGYSQKEMLCLTFEQLFPEREHVEHYKKMKAVIEDYELKPFETFGITKDGKEIPILLSGTIMKNTEGENIGFVGVCKDITEQKQLETERKIYKEKVLEAQKHAYIGTMGAIVAHQLNQPLTTINMRLGKALEISKEKENRHHEVLNNIEKSLSEAKKAASIIQKFRQYSKSSALEGTGKINVSLIADRIISVLSEIAMRAKMRVSTKGLRDLPDVDANEIALEQIFLIIIQNAIEATDGQKPHKLDITGKVIDDNIELQFADDCCGIKPENLEMIFEPFFSTKTEDKRLGLGLDIVQQILISCGGRIRVESQLGKGTTFYVTLPTSNI
jgi:PAS domain S-box-containing protein